MTLNIAKKKKMYNRNHFSKDNYNNHIISYKLTDDILKSLYLKSKL